MTNPGAGANKSIVALAPAPAPEKNLKWLQLRLQLRRKCLAPHLQAPAPQLWFKNHIHMFGQFNVCLILRGGT